MTVEDVYSFVWIEDTSVGWMYFDAVILGSKIVFCLTLLSVAESIEKLRTYGRGDKLLPFLFDSMEFHNISTALLASYLSMHCCYNLRLPLTVITWQAIQ